MHHYTKMFVLQVINNYLVVVLALFGLVDTYPVNFLGLVILIDIIIYIMFLVLQLFTYSKQKKIYVFTALMAFFLSAAMLFFSVVIEYIENLQWMVVGIVIVSSMVSNFHLLRNDGFSKFIDAKESRILGLVMTVITAPYFAFLPMMLFIYPLLVLPNYLGLAFFFVSKTILDWFMLLVDMSFNKKTIDQQYEYVPRIPLQY